MYILNGGISGLSPRTPITALATLPTPGLQGQEFLGDALGPHFAQQKIQDVLGNFSTARVSGSELGNTVGFVVFDDSHDPSGIDHRVGHAELGQRVMKGHRNTVRWRGKNQDIRHFPQALGVKVVDFDQHIVGIFQIGRGCANGGGQIDPAVRA